MKNREAMEYRADALDDAISALDDAIDALKALGNDDAETLAEIRLGLADEAEEISAQLAADDAADRAALTREYWASVL